MEKLAFEHLQNAIKYLRDIHKGKCVLELEIEKWLEKVEIELVFFKKEPYHPINLWKEVFLGSALSIQMLPKSALTLN